jgi:hypothetical protein
MVERGAMRSLLLLALPLLFVTEGAFAKPPARPELPPELKQACASLNQGDPCSITMRGRTMQGTCEVFGDAGLACRPKRGASAPPK